jgi:hypothetical protein
VGFVSYGTVIKLKLLKMRINGVTRLKLTSNDDKASGIDFPFKIYLSNLLEI